MERPEKISVWDRPWRLFQLLVWLWPMIWGFLGLFTNRRLHLLGLDHQVVAIFYLTVFLLPVVVLWSKSAWFRRKVPFLAVFWTLWIFGLTSLTSGTMGMFYADVWCMLFDPQHFRF